MMLQFHTLVMVGLFLSLFYVTLYAQEEETPTPDTPVTTTEPPTSDDVEPVLPTDIADPPTQSVETDPVVPQEPVSDPVLSPEEDTPIPTEPVTEEVDIDVQEEEDTTAVGDMNFPRLPLVMQRPEDDDVVLAEGEEEEICDEGLGHIHVELTPDDYPEEISWEITNLETYEPVVQDQNESLSICVPPGFYVFNISDTAGDGLCCDYGEGSYSIYVDSEPFFESTGEYTTDEKISIPVLLDQSESLDLECAENALSMHMVLVHDDFPEEATWRLGSASLAEITEAGEDVDLEDIAVDWMVEDVSESLSECLVCEDEDTVWVLHVEDAASDGICCAGGAGFYDVYVDGEHHAHGDGEFGSEETILISCSA